MVELHWEGSAPAACAASLFFTKWWTFSVEGLLSTGLTPSHLYPYETVTSSCLRALSNRAGRSGRALEESLWLFAQHTHCTLHTVHCTLCTVHCILYTVHCTLFTALYTAYYKMYTLHCLYIVNCWLYTVRDEQYKLQEASQTVFCLSWRSREDKHNTPNPRYCRLYKQHNPWYCQFT